MNSKKISQNKTKRDIPLIDTLIDLYHTEMMKKEIEKQFPRLNKINYLINTHSHPDHFYGNQVFNTEKIISTERSVLKRRITVLI